MDGVDQGPIEYVDESSTSRFVNSATFSNKFRSEKWSEDETELFYKVTFAIHFGKANKSSVSILLKHEHDTMNDLIFFPCTIQAISQWGTDFGIICKLFPSKTRIAIRNKFKREDRYNRSRVEAALNNKVPIGKLLTAFCGMETLAYSRYTNTGNLTYFHPPLLLQLRSRSILSNDGSRLSRSRRERDYQEAG